MTSDQQKMRALAKEALKLAKKRVPAIVDERILPEALDEVSNYIGELIGKLTNLDAENDMGATMAHGIIYDALIEETINRLRKIMLAAADKRFKKFLKK